MPKNKSNALEMRVAQAKAFAQAWRKVDAKLSLDILTLKNYTKTITALEKAAAKLSKHESSVDSARTEIDNLIKSADDTEIRMRGFAKVKYGANSEQYSDFGGTRTSDYKKSKGRPPKNQDSTPSN